ncbi:hypothetical protein J6W78_00155, partial [bacterium]|nr:hypothetical protein [bacterium]
MKKTTFIVILSFLFAGALSATDTLVNVSTENEGTNCPNGGARIDVGDDDNGNGDLDESEIESTQYVCNGSNGATGVSISDAGTMCGDAGGIKITVGTTSSYVCNGADGQNALSRTSAEGEDLEAVCPNGGIKIEVGLDSSGEG